MCNLCILKKVPEQPVKGQPHTYLHSLVRCHKKDKAATERSTDERIAVVESTVAALSQKVDSANDKLLSVNDRLLRLEGFMERIESALGQSVVPQHA